MECKIGLLTWTELSLVEWKAAVHLKMVGNGLKLRVRCSHRLEKARNVRGNIVGKGLARLSDHLPPELPGSQVRKLFSPITPVRGSGMAPYPAKATQIPPDFLPYFPNGLIARTVVILTEAVRKFPLQTQALELCKYAISEMTPLFREAVETGTLRTDQVFFDSGMGVLLHSLLVYNCDHDGGRVRLGQEARKSDEWLRLAVVAEASAGQANRKRPLAPN